MPFSVILISTASPSLGGAAEMLSQCGIEVITPEMPSAADGIIYRSAACVLIDMPGVSGIETLQMMRRYGVAAPAILIADPGLTVAPDDMQQAQIVDLLQRPTSKDALLRWMEAICTLRILGDKMFPEVPLCAA